MKKINSELFHESICPEEELRAKSYSLDDMSGTMLISLFIMLLGRLVMCGRHMHLHFCPSNTQEQGKFAEADAEIEGERCKNERTAGQAEGSVQEDIFDPPTLVGMTAFNALALPRRGRAA